MSIRELALQELESLRKIGERQYDSQQYRILYLEPFTVPTTIHTEDCMGREEERKFDTEYGGVHVMIEYGRKHETVFRPATPMEIMTNELLDTAMCIQNFIHSYMQNH